MSPTVYGALKSVLVNAGLARVLDFDEADNELTQNNDTPFLVIEEAFADEQVTCIDGAGHVGVEEIGSVIIHSMAPNPGGSVFVRSLGESVRTYIAGAVMLNGSLRIDRCSPPEPLELGNGRWADGVVTADYRYEFSRVASVARA